MDSNDDNKTLMAGTSWLRRAGVAVVLLAAIVGLLSCEQPNKDGDGDGIGTSPSSQNPTPPPPTPRRRATLDDPSGCPVGYIVVQGTAAADVLQGTDANECFVGLAGDDVIFARGGYDIVLAGAGDDFVAASPTTEILDGEDIVLVDD